MKCWFGVLLNRGPRLFLLSLLAGAILFVQGSSRAQTSSTVSNDAAFHRVSNRLQCQCGCHYLVDSCNMVECNSATPLRKTIQAGLAEGKNEDVIVAAFVQQYGPRILSEPPSKGFWLTAWVMPFVVLFLGGTLVSYVLWRWKSKYRMVPSAATAGASTANASSALVEKYRAQIDRELEDED